MNKGLMSLIIVVFSGLMAFTTFFYMGGSVAESFILLYVIYLGLMNLRDKEGKDV